MERVVKLLTDKKKTISFMESCTGGGIANAITNIPGASNVFLFGAVTYSNEFKIKMGVDKTILDKYTVYSREVARDMSKKITLFTSSDYGVGVTGKLLRSDDNNPYGSDDIVFISLYDRYNDKYYEKKVEVFDKDRVKNKDLIINEVISLLLMNI